MDLSISGIANLAVHFSYTINFVPFLVEDLFAPFETIFLTILKKKVQIFLNSRLTERFVHVADMLS